MPYLFLICTLDSFNKWNAGNQFFTKFLLAIAESTVDIEKEGAVVLPPAFIEAIRSIINTGVRGEGDGSLLAYALQLPDITSLLNQIF